MATLVSDIITDAYRESNLIAISATPTTAEVTEGLRLLNRIFYEVFGDEMGEPLETIPLGRNNINRPSGFPYYEDVPYPDWFVPDNTRLALNLSSATTVYLSPIPHDGARFAVQDISGNLATNNLIVNGNGRKIAGATSATLSTNGLVREYFYRADLGEWKQVSDLISSDAWPFPPRFDTMFIVALAMRLNPRHAVDADGQSVEAYRRGLKTFRAQYKQIKEMPSDPGLYRLTGNKQSSDLGGDLANSAFKSGRPL
jgi:hypothetical protein